MLSLSCPSCNTAFTLPAMPADRRAECPRCHDVFPVRGLAEGEAGDGPGTPAAPAARFASPAPPPQIPRWSVRRSVLVAVVMGLVGVGVGWWVSRDRDGEKPGGDPRAQHPASVALPASQLRGLAYLPADTNVVFAAQPGPFLAHAARTKQDPGELVARAGLPRSVLNTLTDLGLRLEQIDHVAGGTHVGDGAFDPRLTLALVLREPPADEDDFLRRLKAKKQPGGKPRYDGTLGALPVTVARVSPTEWVFGLGLGAEPAKNLEALGRGYEAGGRRFRADLAETIATRVPPDAALWVATGDERWGDKPGVEFLVKTLLKRPEWMPSLARGRAGLAAVSVGGEPRLRLFVKAADDDAGRRVRDYFRSLAADPQAVHGGAGTTALYETPVDPAAAYATLQQAFGDAGRK